MPTRPDIAAIRTDYRQGSLELDQVNPDPIKQFDSWFQEAVTSKVAEANAMSLSTIKNGRPANRIVLLKDFTSEGFVFFTNYSSHKGEEIAANPHVALTFWWAELERQVRIDLPPKYPSKNPKSTFRVDHEGAVSERGHPLKSTHHRARGAREQSE